MISMERFIGRKEELKRLDQIVKSGRSEFVAIYGIETKCLGDEFGSA